MNNFNLEKNFLKKQIHDYFPGLKPSSSWPMALNDLIEKLSILKLDEMFNQPFDMTKSLHNETKEFIRNYFNELQNLFKSQLEIEENQISIYKEYLEKAIEVFITVKIHEGSYTNFMDMLNFLRDIYQESQKNEISKIKFSVIFSNVLEKCQSVFNKLTDYINSLNETLPTMRNYNISDLFFISKNILFTPNNRSSGPGFSKISITTDSTYLYIIIAGVSGSMLKVGTGINSTEKGKVYLSKQFESDESVTWVLCKSKLYLKKSSNEIGCLDIININTFQIEGKIKLMINETCLHSLIKKKNENYVLLSDCEKLKIILLEQKLNPDAQEDIKEEIINQKSEKNKTEDDYVSDFEEDCSPAAEKLRIEKKSKELSNIFSHVSVIMYEFDVENHNVKKLSEEKESLIIELEETFSQLYNKAECKKALIMANWDFEKATLFLIDKADKIKEPLLLPCGQIVLFQSKVDPMIIESRNNEYRRSNGTSSVFDIVVFDEFKWVLTEKYVIAYKLRGGYAYIFSLNECDTKFIKHEEYEIYEENYEEVGMKDEGENPLSNVEDENQKSKINDSKNENIDVKNIEVVDRDEKNKCQEDNSENEIEKKLENKTIRGTFLKKVNSIELHKQEYSITYDKETHNYYLITDSITSQTVLKIDTMEDYYNSLTNEFLKNNNCKSIREIFEKLKNKDYLNNFEKFYELFLQIIIIISTRKPDLYSKYRNWNNYLFSQFDRLYNSLDPDSECDTSKKLLLYFKIIQSRFEKTLEYDFNNIKNNLDENILKNYEIVNNKNDSKNELRTYKVKKKVENNNNKTIKIQLDLSKWYFFENYNNINFQYKNEEKIDKIINKKVKSSEKEKPESKEVENYDSLDIIRNNLEFMFENKIDYYLCPEGNINSLEPILNIIEGALDKSKTQVENSENYEKILLNKLFLLYVWFESADVSIGLQFVNSKNNLDYAKGNNTKQDLILEIFEKSLNIIESLYESKSYKIRNLVFMIVLCGWEYICFDAESQVKWFFRAYEHSKDLLKNHENFDFKKFINKKNNNINKNVTIETKIANIILLNDYESEQFNTDYLIYLPFKVLLERINNLNEYVFPYMFHRINKIRMLSFKPKSDDPKILAFKQIEVKANPKNLIFPFYWILNSFYIKNVILNTQKNNEIEITKKKIYQKQFIMEKDLSVNKINKDLSYFVYFDNPMSFSNKGIEFNSYENNLKNYLLVQNCNISDKNYCDQTTNLNFINFHKNSIKLNSFFKDIIRNISNFNQFFLQDILNLQSNSFINLIGDLYYLKKNITNLQIIDLENIKVNKNYEIPDTQRRFDLYLEKFLEILNLNFETIKDKLFILLENKDNMIFFKILRTNLLRHLIFFFYSSFIILRKLNLELQGLLYEKFIELLNFTTKVLNLNDDDLFEKSVKQLKTYTSNGFQIENEKYSEFILNPNEPLNLMEIINYPEASSIAVEIEYNYVTREKNKFEITIICQEHGYNNYRNYNSYNNNNNFGTAFLIEIGNHNIKKKLFLPGNEVKIMNSNDGRSRFQGRESQNRVANNNNNSGGKALKNVLKIKCYPIKTQNYLCRNSNIEKEILEKYLIKNKFDEEEFLLWLDYMNDLDYVLNWFIQNNIKSLDIAKDEKMILENSQYVNLFRLGLGKYPIFKMSEIKLNMTKNQNSLQIPTITNDKNALISSDFDFTKGKSFKEIYFLIYNSITEKMKEIKQPNIETFLKKDRKMDYILSCEENWNEISDDLSSPKMLDDYIYQYLLAIIEEEFDINLQNISFKVIKDDIIKSEMKKLEKLEIEKKDNKEIDNEFREDKEKTKNPLIEFYNNLLNEDKILYDDQNKEFIEYFLRLLIRINETNEIINLNLEKNELFILLSEVRTIVQEPTNYKNMKRFPSFSHKLKNIWLIIEVLFLYCLTYHLNISDKESLGLLLKEISNIRELSNNDQDSNINVNLKNVIEYLGKKLNNLIFWMSSRVQFMKDSFDTIKFQSEDICIKNNEFLENVKKLVIEKIALLKKEKEDLNQKRLEEEKQKSAASQKKKESKKPKEDNKLPKKTPLEKLKEEMGGNKPYNFKKKSNVKRLYQDISQKKKSASTLIMKKEESNKEESGKDSYKDDEKKEEEKLNIPLNELKEKSLDELFIIFPQLKVEFLNRENIKLLKEGIKSNIENDIKEAFFGNNEKLKNICEINDIVFSESNPNESLKNYFNFILKKLNIIYDFENFDICIHMDTENILDKIYLDSPFKVIADYVLEKILFLFELGNERLVNILDSNSILSNNSFNINNFYRKTLSRKITIGNNQLDSKANEFMKIKKYEFEEESFLTLNQCLIIKSIFAFISKSSSIEVIRNHMISQNQRLHVRQIGFEKLKKLISFDNYKNYSFISLNSLGILSYSLNNSILNGIETSVKKINAKSLDLENILIFNLYHINNEINDFLMLNKNNYRNFSLLKSQENSKKEGKNKVNNPLDSSILNCIIEFGNIETFFVHKLKNLVLILSDINILVTYINNMYTSENILNTKSHNILESKKSSLVDEEVNIPLEILKNFIDSSIKIIVNNEINSYSKISKHIGSFSGILKSVLGKLITYKNNEAIYSAVLDSLFSSLENFNIHSYDEQINSVVNILGLIYHIVSMIPQGNSNISNTKANLNKLLNVLLNSDIPQIVNIASKIAKVFFKNIFSRGNNKPFENENVEEEEKIFTSIFKKIGKLWAFKDEEIKKYCLDENQLTINNFGLNIAEDKNKKYYIFVQINSPEFDYLFFINVLFQWEEIYPTKLSEYKVQILKLLDENFTEEEITTLIDIYNKKCEKNEFLNLYKIDYKNIKEKFNSKNYNTNKNSKNEFKINLHKFKEMVYFNPLKSKNGKTHTVIETLNKSTTEIIKKIEENTKKLSELHNEREKLIKVKEEENVKLNNAIKEEAKAENQEIKNEEIVGENKEEKKEQDLVNQNNINISNNNIENKENNQNISENNLNIQIEPKIEENPLPFSEGEIPLENKDEPKKECVSENKISIEEQEYILKNEIEILKIKELYNKRLSKHIEYAQLIGNNSSGRGFAVIEGDFTKEKAEHFSDLIWRAFYRQLPCVLNTESIFIPPFKKFSPTLKTEKEINSNSIEKSEIEVQIVKIENHEGDVKNEDLNKNSKIENDFDKEFIKDINFLFDETIIFPNFHEFNNLLPACTNILKETTKQYLNISLMENSVYTKFCETINIFKEKFFLKADPDTINSKKPISGNFNDIGKKILNDKLINGKSIYIILEELINLILSPCFNNSQKIQDFGEYQESHVALFAKLLNNVLKDISNENMKNEIYSDKKFLILGLLIVSSGFFNILRIGSIAQLNNNPKDICKIIAGGHLTGRQNSNVIFLKDKSTRIEKVSNNNLKKQNHLYRFLKNEVSNLVEELSIAKNNPYDSEYKSENTYIPQSSFASNKQGSVNLNNINNIYNTELNFIELINLDDLLNAINCAIDTFSVDEKNEINKNILFFLLKFFNLFGQEDILYNQGQNDKISLIFEKLNSLTEKEKWIEKSEDEWEIEFIDSWQRIYSKLDKNSNKFYSPPKNFLKELKNLYEKNNTKLMFEESIDKTNKNNQSEETYILSKKHNFISVDKNSNELISKLTLPDSAYGADLPGLTDYSKCTLALKNIQIFERYIVEEIFRYCGNTYREAEYFYALPQIRFNLSLNDIASAKADIYEVFDQTKLPPYTPLPKEHRDMREIFKEECYPGNYYLAKINQKVARETGINYLIKLSNLGLFEVPVLLLLVDTSLNQALVQFDDYMDQSKMNSFWIQLDNLYSLDYNLKLPASSYSMDDLYSEYNSIQNNLIKIYAKNILINLNKFKLKFNNLSPNTCEDVGISNLSNNENICLNNKQISNKFNMKNFINFLNLEFWQFNKLSPITGVFSSFKNYIKVKQVDEMSLRSKESFLNIDNNGSIDINQILYQINNFKKKLNQSLNNPDLQNIYESNLEEIEKFLCELCFSDSENYKMLKNWCFESWENLLDEIKHLRFDLFKEYMTQFNLMRTENQFNIGNMGNKLLALHELGNFDTNNICGIILSFEQSAILGPNAKLSFYSDKDGVNLIHEITAIKNTKSNLQSIIFNYSKIWMNYTPGTRAFYIHDWHMQTRDSNLPCCLSFIPHYWSCLIWLSDFTTSSLFSSYSLENFEIFKEFIKKLLGFCSSTKIPVDLQTNIFNITNRIILKANKYIQELEKKKLINFENLSLYEKMGLIGIDEFTLIELIKHIDRFNTMISTESKDKNFSSSYVVDGVEIILSILSIIKESYQNLDFYFRESFDYSLPIWIEAIIKLGQFLNLFQNVSQLESELSREIKSEICDKDKIYDIFIIKNIPGYIEDQIIIKEIKKYLSSLNIQICDTDIDIVVIDKNRYKFDLIFNKNILKNIDNFLITNINEKHENSENRHKEETKEIIIESGNIEMQNKNKDENKIDPEKNELEINTVLKKEGEEDKFASLNKFFNIDKNYTKELCILIDGVKVETLREVAEPIEEIEESTLWKCAGCEMENDMENLNCIFCDMEKTVKPKEKKKKQTLIKVDSYIQTINDVLTEFKNGLKNNPNLNTFSYEVPFIENQQEEVKSLENTTNPDPIIENCETLKKEQNTEVKENVNNDENNKKIENSKKYINEKIIKDLEILTPEEIKKNKNLYNDILSDFYKIRITKWIIQRSTDIKEIINDLKFFSSYKGQGLDQIKSLIDFYEKDSKHFETIFNSQSNQDVNSNSLSSESVNKISELSKYNNINFLNLMQDLEAYNIDIRLEITKLNDNQLQENINLEILEKIREIIDLNICKETNISFVLPPKAVRFTHEDLNSLNCFNSNLIKKAISPKGYNLSQIRYYWSIIKYFNNCLLAALPFIKPPDMNSDNSIPKNSEFSYIPFPKSISAFLSSAKGLTFSFTKQNLINQVIAYTEFPEEQIQIPTFKFERLNIFNNLTEDKNKKNKILNNDPSFIRSENLIGVSNNDKNKISNDSNNNEEDENTNGENDLKVEESIFLQAYEQFKDIDIAFFRSKKAPGDPHIGFKVEFKGEFVQGIGGPYRQFFSDISSELQPKDIGDGKILKLLYPSSNKQAIKGDFKDKYVIRPLLTDNNSMKQFEFLGVLMGICIRTGVHLTLDLCSIFWKKLVKYN